MDRIINSGLVLIPYPCLRAPICPYLLCTVYQDLLLTGMLTEFWSDRYLGEAIDLRGMSGLRTFRVLRALKTVSVIPGELLSLA